MADIERQVRDLLGRDTTPDPSIESALKTTPGVYYFAEGSREIRPEIIEKIRQISQGKY